MHTPNPISAQLSPFRLHVHQVPPAVPTSAAETPVIFFNSRNNNHNLA